MERRKRDQQQNSRIISALFLVLAMSNTLLPAWCGPGRSVKSAATPLRGAVPDTLLVRLSADADKEEVTTLLQEVHGTVTKTIRVGQGLTILVVKTEKGRAAEVTKKLAKDKNIGKVSADIYCSAISIGDAGATVPNDPGYADQWALYFLKHAQCRQQVRSRPATAANLTFLDTGISPVANEHFRITQYNCVDGGDDPTLETPFDSGFHGTAVASVAAATTNNGIGIAGVANLEGNNCYITMFRISKDGLNSTSSSILSALSFIANNSATRPGPVNLSFGTSAANSINSVDVVQQIALMLQQRGCLLVLAAGNDGAEDPSPEKYCRRIASIDPNGSRSSFSTYGPFRTAAPGRSIRSYDPSHPDPSYPVYYNGTSLSAPLYSGAIGLTMSYMNAPNAVSADAVVQATATSTQSGLIVPNLADAVAAVTAPPPTPAPPPSPAPPPPPEEAAPSPSAHKKKKPGHKVIHKKPIKKPVKKPRRR